MCIRGFCESLQGWLNVFVNFSKVYSGGGYLLHCSSQCLCYILDFCGVFHWLVLDAFRKSHLCSRSLVSGLVVVSSFLPMVIAVLW